MKINKNKNYYRKKIKMLAFWLIFLLLIIPGLAINARVFDPNNIILDSELFSSSSLSKTAIQRFLERENSVLSRYGQIINGQSKSAAEIIFEVASSHNISSKFLLTTLEKEKGLITSPYATEKDLDWATGYSCFGGSCNEKYRGFYDQVESSAITQNIYKEKASQFAFKVGQTTKSYDGYSVTPANQATANLYIYTPYVGHAPELGINFKYGANKLFWKIWNQYFPDRKYPDGLVLKNNGNFWLIENNKKRKFASQAVFLKDYSENEAILVNQETLNAYEDGPIIYFPNNTLVRSNATGQAFLLLDKQKKPITDESALATLSSIHIATNSIAEIPLVDNEKLIEYPVGNPVTATSVYPQGKLFKDEFNQIYLAKDGLKYPIDPAVWLINYKKENPEPITLAELNDCPTATPVKIKDGSLVKSISGNYYLITNDKKSKIKEVETAQKIFGADKFQTAVVVPDSILNLHEDSLIIAYIDDAIQDSTMPATPINPVATETYSAVFAKMTPDGLIMFANEVKNISIEFKNSGTTVWQQGQVWLQAEGSEEKINFSDSSVASGQTATFYLNYKAPNKIGLNSQNFGLYREKNGLPEQIATFGKFVLVNSGTTSEVVSHNLPVAVRNNWRPIQITVKIKNTSADTVWLSRKTALEIYDENGLISPFYDPNDWVRKEVAAVPINKSQIKPGEIGEFRFTLKLAGVKTGVHNLKFKLKLLDQGKEVYINGQESWEKPIRVDG